MQLIALGNAIPGFIVMGLFLMGAAIGLFQGVKKHPFGYVICVSIGVALIGHQLIGSWGLLTPGGLVLIYLWARYG